MGKNIKEVISVLFFNDWQATNLLKIANTISEKLEVFDGEPLVLPMKNSDAPPQVPRIVLQNNNNSLRLEISLLRAVLIIKNDIENKLEESRKLSIKLAKSIFDNFQWEINRIGEVVSTIFCLDSNSIDRIKNLYFKEDKLKDIHQLKLHWLNKIVINDEELNRWIKLDTTDGKNNNELILKCDINMIKDDNREKLSFEFVNNFFNNINEKIINDISQLN